MMFISGQLRTSPPVVWEILKLSINLSYVCEIDCFHKINMSKRIYYSTGMVVQMWKYGALYAEMFAPHNLATQNAVCGNCNELPEKLLFSYVFK